MFLSTIQFFAPSLWFVSAFGLAQIGPKTVELRTENSAVRKPKLQTKRMKRSKKTKPTLMAQKKLDIPRKKTTSAKQPKLRKKKDKMCLTTSGTVTNIQCVVEQLQRTYQTANTLLADFEQIYTYSVYQRTQTSKGRLFIKKPGKMRWDYSSPETKVFVSNGDVLWVYEPSKAQAYKRPLKDAELPIAIRFLMGEGNLLDEFSAKLGTVTDTTITAILTPKQTKTQYKELRLVVNRKDFMVVETLITDPVNNTNRVRFSALKTNESLPDRGFEFTPPKGVKVVR